MNKSSRYDDLELLRGLAAIAVVVYHFLRAFLPPHQIPVMADKVGIAVERPFVLALVNGPFMVTIFFVLSSFALTVKMVEHRAPTAVLVAMAKRFPRLYPLTLIGSLLPAMIFAAGLMYNEEAASLTGSHWLSASGGVKVGENWPDPSSQGVLADSLLLFWRGLSQYNSVLWTMRYELLGSLMALGTALTIAGARRPLIDVAVTCILALLALKVHPLCSICVLTVLLTKYLRGSDLAFGGSVAAALILGGLAIGSTYKPFPEELARDPQIGHHILRLDWLIHGLGAFMIFLGVHRWRRASTPDWPFARFLGRFSFAIYVLHVPIIGSVASAVVYFMGYSWLSIVAAALTTVGGTAALAWWVAGFDRWWVEKLNNATHSITSNSIARRGVRAQGADAP